jgi:hypothetical protein
VIVGLVITWDKMKPCLEQCERITLEAQRIPLKFSSKMTDAMTRVKSVIY